MIGRKTHRYGEPDRDQDDLHDEFREIVEEYEDEKFEIEPPMHSIKRNLPRGSGYRKKSGISKRTRSGPLNRTHGKSPFTYASGIKLYRGSKSEESEEYPEKKCKSWGVPWK